MQILIAERRQTLRSHFFFRGVHQMGRNRVQKSATRCLLTERGGGVKSYFGNALKNELPLDKGASLGQKLLGGQWS